MRLTSIVSLSAALLLAAPAAAQDASQAINSVATAAVQADKPAAEEKKVCKRVQGTGSNRIERVCLSKEEWKRIDEMK